MSEDPDLWEAQISGIKHDVGDEAAAWAEIEVELNDQDLAATRAPTTVRARFLGAASRDVTGKRPR
ncbi:hypothetical protein [Actinomyces gaoshouyii]|uniref:hypothetical protein n=1 Tax=Actinomyces gaoshouyii TaxID=1960083 RepID=UPI0009BD15FD|nr:hypothetical protein [Actinomyces gaoshouyii]ARD42460.1 hypothetical protein B6G06_09025 [Actinomyces gaoshouyii]